MRNEFEIKNRHTESLAEATKGCFLVGSSIGVVLYIGFRIIFSDFETTLEDEFMLFLRLLIGSLAVVTVTAILITMIKTAGKLILRHQRQRRALRLSR
jgi:hypothetical protein